MLSALEPPGPASPPPSSSPPRTTHYGFRSRPGQALSCLSRSCVPPTSHAARCGLTQRTPAPWQPRGLYQRFVWSGAAAGARLNITVLWKACLHFSGCARPRRHIAGLTSSCLCSAMWSSEQHRFSSLSLGGLQLAARSRVKGQASSSTLACTSQGYAGPTDMNASLVLDIYFMQQTFENLRFKHKRTFVQVLDNDIPHCSYG
jgi:hypothetical protein